VAAAVGPASSAPFAAAAANGASRVLEFELAAGLQPQLRQIAIRFGVSAEVALREFVRFLEIKQWAQDSEHTKISPTPLMDAVWHAALLETKLYDRIEAHIGMRLHHSTAAAAEDGTTCAAREERLTALRQLYQLRYNEQPAEPIAPIASVAARAPRSDILQLFVLSLDGQMYLFEVLPTDSIEAFKQRIQEKTGIPPDQQRLIYAGKEVRATNIERA
jgi:hypothetical protein